SSQPHGRPGRRTPSRRCGRAGGTSKSMGVQWLDRAYTPDRRVCWPTLVERGEDRLLLARQAHRVAGRWLGRDARVSLPNLVTLGRILLVPVVVWAITAGELRIAFALFLAAGITDAVDGFLAKRFGMTTE